MQSRTKLMMANAKKCIEVTESKMFALDSRQDKCLMNVPACVSNVSTIPQAETTFFDAVVDISNQFAAELLDNSYIDPNYMHEGTSDSVSSEPDKERSPRNKVQISLSMSDKPKGKRKMSSKEKIGRKRIRNTSGWIDVKAKRELDLGLAHKNRKGKFITSKQIKHPCKEKCRNKCREKISEESRKKLFEEFWKIGHHTRQWDYIARCVKTLEKKQVRKTDCKSKRNFSRKYMLTVNNIDISVCKTMFLNTHGISEQWVTTALSKIGKTGYLEEDRRGKHATRPNKIHGDIINSIRQHIQLFPLVPSHYTRRKSTKMYLEDGLNIATMHRLYLEHMQHNTALQPATLRQYREIFNSDFNMAFFKPKKTSLKCKKNTIFLKESKIKRD